MKVLLEIKPNRFIYLLMLPFTIGFTYLFIWALYLMEEPVDDVMGMIFFNFFILVCVFLTYHWFMSFIKNPATFTVYEDGFVSNTNGVKSPLVKWKDIRKIEISSIQTRSTEAALAIYFHDFRANLNQQPAIVRMLTSVTVAVGVGPVRNAVVNSEDDVPMLIPISAFGDRYHEVKAILDNKVLSAKP